MCLIIDACVRDRVFASPPHEDARPVLRWINEQDGRLVYGGRKLCDELFESERARRQIRTWKQAGRALAFPDDKVDGEVRRLRQRGLAVSNDLHVIALALVSGARTLYSTDSALHADFKNSKLLSDPAGAVYQTRDHAHLLMHTPSCRAARPQAEP